MKTRVTELTLTPDGQPLFHTTAILVGIEDEGAGEFVTLASYGGEIRIDEDEWPAVKAAVDRLLKEMKEETK